ncbi:MAG TPA: ABC transporter permease [Acidimicrobiales bacterium]|jgi:osmoprotectant transport system permease protein|nr:ABC transporter permease [Acidimicrobiales bacterium]
MGAVQDFTTYITTASHWWGERGILHRSLEHMRLSAASVFAAGAIAIPPALALGHGKRGGFLAQSIVNIGRAVPSFAILALLFPLALSYGFGLGFWPTFGALVFLAIPPMFTNTYVGVRGVDPSIVEASRGMGMGPAQVLFRVETPIARPLILTGVRIAAVQVVATATLGAFVGFNGLGSYIDEGFRQQDDGKLLTGAIGVAVLAFLTELVFSLVVRRATPWLAPSRVPDVVPPEQVEVLTP